MISKETRKALCISLIVFSALQTVSFADETLAATTSGRVVSSMTSDEIRKSEKLQIAIDRAYALIEKGVSNYPSHRQCFSCHHQALSLLSRSLNNRLSPSDSRDDFCQDPLTKSILNFTEASFAGKRTQMKEGRGVGGKALTVAYGLWTMDLAGAKRNETIDAMVEYLLKTQSNDGAWDFQSLRPPAASSRAMTTAIAVYGLRAYGPDYAEPNRLRESLMKARDFANQADETTSQEESNGYVWLDYMLDHELRMERVKSRYGEKNPSDPLSASDDTIDLMGRVFKQMGRIWSIQRDDGGWGQTPDMASDAYATGQTLLILSQVQYRDKKTIHDRSEFLKGIQFLLRSQEADGSWHVTTRAKPVQVFFDNGDPHGKDQFISVMATNWAVAALANFREFGFDPLESAQVVNRQEECIRSIINQSKTPRLNPVEDLFGSPIPEASKNPFER